VVGLSSYPFINIWDIHNWKMRTLRHDINEPIYSIDIKDNFIIATSNDTVYIYNWKSEKTIKYSLGLQQIVFVSWIYNLEMHAIIMQHNGEWSIYKFVEESSKRLLNVPSIAGLVTGFIQPFECIISVHIRGYKVICGYQNGNIKSWIFTKDNWSYHPQPTMSSISDKVTAIQIVSNMVVGATWDGRVRIWDSKKDSLRRSLKCEQSSGVTSIAIINGMIVTGHYNGTMCYWNFELENSKSRKRIKIYK
jgi:WD40 repeat protein